MSSFALLQEDETLGDLLADRASLENLLDLLCGVTRKKEGDAAVRNSLAESVEMLVSELIIFSRICLATLSSCCNS